MSGRGSAKKQLGRSWEDELSEQYSEGHYEELIPRKLQSSTAWEDMSLPNMDTTKTKRNGAMRFPPKNRISLPGEISRLLFAPVALVEPDGATKSKRIGQDLLEKKQFLESSVADIASQVSQNRHLCRTHGAYLYSLPFPPHDADLPKVKKLLSQDLVALLDEAQKIGEDIHVMRTETIDEFLPSEISSAHPILSKAQQSITKRCETLRTEASMTEMVLHNLVDLADDLLSVHHGPSCKLDGVEPDWGHLGNFQEEIRTSNKALCYVAWMEARSLPICDAVFEFLQTPTQNDHILAIVGYVFAPRELCELMEYITTNAGRTPIILPAGDEEGFDNDDASMVGENLYGALGTPRPLYMSNVVHQLIIDECQLTDYDVNTIATHLPALTGLHTLCLRGNNITSLGATSLSTVLWDRASQLKVLRLDRNCIAAEGALSISKAMCRCRYLQALSLSFNPIGDVGVFYILRSIMNPVRKARTDLPRPFQLSKKDGEYDYDDDIESTYSDDEDIIHRMLRQRHEQMRDDKADEEEWKGSEDQTAATSLYDSDTEYVDDDKFGYRKRRNKNRGAGDDDDDTDIYSMPNDEEDVYSVALSRRSSVQLNPSAASLSLTRISSKYEALALARMPLFLRKFRLVRFKMIAVSAFLRVKSRGHGLYSLSVAGCSLSSISLGVVSHALIDNHNIGSLDLSHNPVGVHEGELHGAARAEELQEQHDATHVLGVAEIQFGMSRKEVRAAISAVDKPYTQISGRYETFVYDLSIASGIHPERLETVIFPAILKKDSKEIFANLLCDTGLQTLSLRSCGLQDDAVQQIVQIVNRSATARNQRESAESCAMNFLRNPNCIRDQQRDIILREHGISISLASSDEDVHHHKMLLTMDKGDLDQITATLKTKYQKPFLQSLQKRCYITTLDISDNHLGPTSANWVASASGHFFLDDLQIGVGYVSACPLPRKPLQMHGHSHRQSLLDAEFDEGEFSEEEYSDMSDDDARGASRLSPLLKTMSDTAGFAKQWIAGKSPRQQL